MSLQKIKKYSLILSLVFFSSLVAFLACLIIIETFFFDKFFYKKSAKYGYIDVYAPAVRNFDLRELGFMHGGVFVPPHIPSVLERGEFKTNTYNIALVGDSFVWGDGVKEQQRLSVVLENKLNEEVPTRVYALGFSQDGLLDHLGKIDALSQMEMFDLYIIPAVMNDALPANSINFNRYHSAEVEQIVQICQALYPGQRVRSFPEWKDMTPEELDAVIRQLDEDTGLSWSDELSICLNHNAAKRIQELTKGRVLYLLTDDYTEEQQLFAQYRQLLEQVGSTYISSRNAASLPEYQKYWQNPEYYFHVSALERHPSSLAYRMYADVLKQELLKNTHWQFCVSCN